MKNKITRLLVFSLMVVLLTSCNKVDNDYYFPKVKLAAVELDGSNWISFQYNGKYISNIIVYGQTCNVTYNEKDQIAEIVNEDEKLVFTYDGKKIIKIEDFEAGELYYYEDFKYNADGTIASVSSYASDKSVDNWKKVCQKALFNHMFDARPLKAMLEKSSKGDLAFESVAYWSFTNGNIKTVSTVYGENGASYTITDVYEYDENHNPFFGLPYALASTYAYSKNNVTLTTTSLSYAGTPGNSQTQTTEYTYNSKKYPLNAISKIGEREVGNMAYTYVK